MPTSVIVGLVTIISIIYTYTITAVERSCIRYSLHITATTAPRQATISLTTLVPTSDPPVIERAATLGVTRRRIASSRYLECKHPLVLISVLSAPLPMWTELVPLVPPDGVFGRYPDRSSCGDLEECGGRRCYKADAPTHKRSHATAVGSTSNARVSVPSARAECKVGQGRSG